MTTIATRNPAWYRAGADVTQLGDDATSAQILAAADLDWTVEKHPITTNVVTEAGGFRLEVPRKTAHVAIRPDGHVLGVVGVVGDGYHSYQNHQIHRLIEQVAGEAGLTLTAAGWTHNRARVFFAVDLPHTVEVGGRDPVGMTLVGQARHDGYGGVGFGITAGRLACTNQLQGLKQFSVAHTSNMEARLDDIRRGLDLVVVAQQELAVKAETLITRPFTHRDMVEFAERMFPIRPDAKQAGVTRALNKRAAITDLFSGPYMAGIEGTAWAAYNAVTEWADWYGPVRGGDDPDVARAERVISGATDAVKTRAMDLLLA